MLRPLLATSYLLLTTPFLNYRLLPMLPLLPWYMIEIYGEGIFARVL